MSKDSIEKRTVRRFNIDVIEKGDADSFDELMGEGFVNHAAPAGVSTGPESMWNMLANTLRPALSDLKVTIHEQLQDGDKVTSRKTITGQHTGAFMGIAATGRHVSIDVIDIVRVKNGQYIEHWGVNTLGATLTTLRN